MTLSEWIQQGSQSPGKAAVTRLEVRNLTSQSILASDLEVANQGANRRKGLLGRDGLQPGSGLWIKPCEAVHTFFMRFPIDLVYLDRKLRVRKVRRSVGPWRMSACLSAHSVLELPAGTILATQTRKGDMLDFASLPVQEAASAPAEATPASLPRSLAVSL